MTNNEKIARWLGIKIYERSGFAVTEDVYIMKKEGRLLFVDEREDEPAWYWQPDTDITLWHGTDGILAKIEKRGKRGVFLDALMVANAWDVDGRWNPDFIWLIRRAEPAQLTVALVKMIEEEATDDQR